MPDIPWISAIIPTYGQVGVDLTAQCLRSMRDTHGHLNIEKVVVDDGSPDSVVWELREVCASLDARLIANKRPNGGFAKTCNEGLRDTNGVVRILVNNDIVFDKCPALQIVADTSTRTGAAVVGCRLLYPDDKIQHAGVTFVPAEGQSIPGYFDHFLRGQHALHHAAVTMQEVLVTGALFAIHTNAISCFGVLDERFGMAAEDIDYCMEAISSGWHVLYNGYAYAYHHEGRTRGNTIEEKEKLAPGHWAAEKIGLARFFRKWIGIDWSMFAERI